LNYIKDFGSYAVESLYAIINNIHKSEIRL